MTWAKPTAGLGRWALPMSRASWGLPPLPPAGPRRTPDTARPALQLGSKCFEEVYVYMSVCMYV